LAKAARHSFRGCDRPRIRVAAVARWTRCIFYDLDRPRRRGRLDGTRVASPYL